MARVDALATRKGGSTFSGLSPGHIVAMAPVIEPGVTPSWREERHSGLGAPVGAALGAAAGGGAFFIVKARERAR